MVTLTTLPDIGQLPKFKMADCKPEVECISGTNEISAKIPTATPHFHHAGLTGDTVDIAQQSFMSPDEPVNNMLPIMH